MQLSVLIVGLCVSLSSAHFDITYPYWRGDSSLTQSAYPCGDVGQTNSANNRTAWPFDGGALVFTTNQSNAQTYVNLGLGNDVTRLNIVLVPPFNQTGSGTFCFPRIPIPADLNITAGTNASIQVIQLSATSGALYNCADITFEQDAPGIGSDVCFNTTGVGSAPFTYDDEIASCPTQRVSSTSTSTGTATGSSSTGTGSSTGKSDGAGLKISRSAVSVIAGMVIVTGLII
ncbi:18S rRNA pseudouridine methyltransferase [Rhizina undulata]